MIRVTATNILDESLWGAQEAYDEGGEKGGLEVIQEDWYAFLEDAKWKVEVLP